MKQFRNCVNKSFWKISLKYTILICIGAHIGYVINAFVLDIGGKYSIYQFFLYLLASFIASIMLAFYFKKNKNK